MTVFSSKIISCWVHVLRRGLPLLLVMVGTLAAAPTSPVGIGEVTSRVNLDPELQAKFQKLLEDELDVRLSDVKRAPSERYVLSASLMRLDTVTSRDAATTYCEVSATLRTARGGDLVAFFSGRGRAELDRKHATKSRISALDAAVRGAVSRLPDALK